MTATLIILALAGVAQATPIAANESLFWGTYRPNLYFGTRTRSVDPVLTGLMWHGVADYAGFRDIRHTCEQGEIGPYGWGKHDGRRYGSQTLSDPKNNVTIRTEFLKTPGGSHGSDNQAPPSSKLPSVLQPPNLAKVQFTAFNMPAGQVWQVKKKLQEKILQSAQAHARSFTYPTPSPAQIFSLSGNVDEFSNVYVFQKAFRAPFEPIARVLAKNAVGEAFTEQLAAAEKSFDQRFETTYGLKAKNYDKKHIDMAKYMVSNMVGGMGYFHGHNIIDRALEDIVANSIVDLMDDIVVEEEDDYFGGSSDDPQEQVKPNPQIEGPDEGFHQLLIGSWDNDMSLDVIKHWADLIDSKGWVAREQILGEEAHSKVAPDFRNLVLTLVQVPKEFQTQYSHFGNPPMLLMSLMSFIKRSRSLPSGLTFDSDDLMGSIANSDNVDLFAKRHLLSPHLTTEYLRSVYEKFKAQYYWFRATQWGLDDYPRGHPPSPGELHVDLLSWVAFMANSLSTIAEEIDLENDALEYRQHFEDMLLSLEDIHWNDNEKLYCDAAVDQSGNSYQPIHPGYLSLFPFVLGLVPEASPKVKYFLALIKDDSHLWTPYGLRSLSKSDPFYATDENYWRGPIWININYLVLSTLHKYKSGDGPYKAEAEMIYNELRTNLVKNVFKEYKATGVKDLLTVM
ncbi:Processing alpha glucosidase I [Irineochytrium annulatum]|nr:Processing alpha glucosidase I [Irineochytrium annulatum]